jgi:hypothetical protein
VFEGVVVAGVCAPGKEIEGRGIGKDCGMEFEGGRSTGILGEEIDVGVAGVVPQLRDLRRTGVSEGGTNGRR